MFYIVTDVLTTLGTFGMIMLLSRAGLEAEQHRRLQRPGRRSPWFAGVMAVFMFSLAGIPPTVGFYAKLAVLQALVSTNVPATSGSRSSRCVLSLVGAYYYLRVVKVMYFDEPVDTHADRARATCASLLSFNGAAVLLLGILPGGLMQLCAQAIVQMFAT